MVVIKNRTITNTVIKKNQSIFGRIIVLTGARQTGKTTLIKRVFPNYEYISIEDPVTVETYKNLTASQWNTFYPNAIIDEIQKEPQLVESIKAVYDQFTKTHYILLGSSQILLLKKIRESLAGRCQIIEMYPLTLPELMTKSWNDNVQLSYLQNMLLENPVNNIPFLLDKKHPQKQKAFDTFQKFGGYPAISDSNLSDEEKHSWLKNYVRTYLERDIRDLAEIRNLEPFTRIQKQLAINTAQHTNFSKIAEEAGITSKTAKRFLEYMNISYQVFILQPWFKNSLKRLKKSAKVHYMDIGILRTILNKQNDLNGSEYESVIVCEIFKQIKAIDFEASFYHIRTVDGREVDLLIETEKGYYAIEIKNSKKVRTTDGRHLKGLDNILDKPILKKIIISNDLDIKTYDDNIIAIPAVKFLI